MDCLIRLERRLLLMAPQSPAVARWELSFRTRKRRDELGITGPQIAKELKFSATYWPKVERDQRILSEEKLTQLLQFLGFSEEDQRDLIEVRRLAGERGWWSEYEGLFSEQQLRLFGMEYGAEEISTVESLLIPGLLQTEEYARTLITGYTAFIRQIEVQQRIDARLARQKRLSGDDPLRLNVVVSEAALRQQTGGPDVLRNQLRHLIATIEEHWETINFRVLPFTSHTGAIRGCSTFHILDFPRPRLPTLAWSEVPTHDELVEDQQRVRNLTIVFGHLQQESLSREDSLHLLKELVDRDKTAGE
ncbi:Scr1 family TA system antitoxin-like transcriptional regulator [Nocardia farcinica]|uniref:Scr1 family TA system antitoxin-like transcriptional regulator n=1 Tax=Nocardia farcinica TaxID=37329 RepID=UPI001E2DE4DB|nr:Scr1 family TA system antitoxin-like transcriptional regulator [Nocardia farcinica]UEX26320.1 Scr1 family TA system antitoxin-like transcriptional regulator [Nocardia farcinica]